MDREGKKNMQKRTEMGKSILKKKSCKEGWYKMDCEKLVLLYFFGHPFQPWSGKWVRQTGFPKHTAAQAQCSRKFHISCIHASYFLTNNNSSCETGKLLSLIQAYKHFQNGTLLHPSLVLSWVYYPRYMPEKKLRLQSQFRRSWFDISKIKHPSGVEFTD